MGNTVNSQFSKHCLSCSFLLSDRTPHTPSLFQCGFFLWDVVLQEQSAPAWVLHRATDPARSLFQHRLLTGSQTPSGIYLLQSILHGLQVDLFYPMDIQGLQGHCRGCCIMVFPKACGGISALGPGAPPAPLSLTWEFAEFLLLHIFTPFF